MAVQWWVEIYWVSGWVVGWRQRRLGGGSGVLVELGGMGGGSGDLVGLWGGVGGSSGDIVRPGGEWEGSLETWWRSRGGEWVEAV